MDYVWILAALAGGYLVGSLSFAVIVSRAMGLADPRSYGSGNPGATNVLRSGSKPAAILTLALDALKGYLPVLAVLAFGPRVGLGEKSLAKGEVEVKPRNGAVQFVKTENAVEAVLKLIADNGVVAPAV